MFPMSHFALEGQLVEPNFYPFGTMSESDGKHVFVSYVREDS